MNLYGYSGPLNLKITITIKIHLVWVGDSFIHTNTCADGKKMEKFMINVQFLPIMMIHVHVFKNCLYLTKDPYYILYILQ